MDDMTADGLVALNKEFYRANHDSFSATRRSSWRGWQRVADTLPRASSAKVLDVACGNLRFERYLDVQRADLDASYLCVDSCAELMQAGAADAENRRLVELDVIGWLKAGGRPFYEAGTFDLAVMFGFLHHVPTADLRLSAIELLIDAVRPKGFAACSFWRFADDAPLRRKALETTREARRSFPYDLDAGDYLLGWDGRAEAYRYCHSFTTAEIDGLVARIGAARLVDRFRSDGRTNGLNEYLVLQKLD